MFSACSEIVCVLPSYHSGLKKNVADLSMIRLAQFVCAMCMATNWTGQNHLSQKKKDRSASCHRIRHVRKHGDDHVTLWPVELRMKTPKFVATCLTEA